MIAIALNTPSRAVRGGLEADEPGDACAGAGEQQRGAGGVGAARLQRGARATKDDHGAHQAREERHSAALVSQSLGRTAGCSSSQERGS
jgi:hypothetical protein